MGAQWISGRVLDSRPGVSLATVSKNINPSLVLVQPRKTRPFITERLLMGRKGSNQTNKIIIIIIIIIAKKAFNSISSRRFQHLALQYQRIDVPYIVLFSLYLFLGYVFLTWRNVARYTLRLNVFVVRRVIYLFIIIPDEANIMAKR